ncbi:MAG: hypothetical protein MH204_10230 [Fimbriimonadaceae bacterium]|nr:hypothetical protein [Fimbriimonadaceae bacterium]
MQKVPEPTAGDVASVFINTLGANRAHVLSAHTCDRGACRVFVVGHGLSDVILTVDLNHKNAPGRYGVWVDRLSGDVLNMLKSSAEVFRSQMGLTWDHPLRIDLVLDEGNIILAAVDLAHAWTDPAYALEGFTS